MIGLIMKPKPREYHFRRFSWERKEPTLELDVIFVRNKQSHTKHGKVLHDDDDDADDKRDLLHPSTTQPLLYEINKIFHTNKILLTFVVFTYQLTWWNGNR